MYAYSYAYDFSRLNIKVVCLLVVCFSHSSYKPIAYGWWLPRNSRSSQIRKGSNGACPQSCSRLGERKIIKDPCVLWELTMNFLTASNCYNLQETSKNKRSFTDDWNQLVRCLILSLHCCIPEAVFLKNIKYY